MEIKELQEESEKIVNKIDEKLKAKHDDSTLIIHLTEELGEVSRQILNPKLNRAETNAENLGEEIADMFILLSKLANIKNIDVEKSIKDKFNKLNQRHEI